MSMQYLSLHIIFSIKVDIRQYQECIQNGQNMNFDFFAPEFGALPILQDCPCMTITADNDYNNKYYDKDYDDFNNTKTTYFDKIRSPWHVASVYFLTQITL